MTALQPKITAMPTLCKAVSRGTAQSKKYVPNITLTTLLIIPNSAYEYGTVAGSGLFHENLE